jgi:transcriptional regulator with XRE-family HTH domain
VTEIERTEDADFSYRLRQAVKALELARGKDLTQDELGELVAKKQGRGEPYTGVAVHRWLKGRRPGYETMRALAAVLAVRPGWLAFGEGELDGVNATRSRERSAESRAAMRRGGRNLRSAQPGRRRSDRSG